MKIENLRTKVVDGQDKYKYPSNMIFLLGWSIADGELWVTGIFHSQRPKWLKKLNSYRHVKVYNF